MIVPIGFGQRGLIVSPPRAGKTIFMQKMAKSVLANFPEAYVIMLLIDERPEEVTDMEREVKGKLTAKWSVRPSMSLLRGMSRYQKWSSRKAKRMVEFGTDVVIFLDSITRLARAWNSECPQSGKTLSGGLEANAMQRPKRFFGSARKVEEGGSLTIVATALVDTGSKMDDVIFEEFKGNGQSRNRAGPSVGRQTHLAGDRHQPQRDSPRRDADGPRGTQTGRDSETCAGRNERPRRDGAAHDAIGEDQDQCRILDEHELQSVRTYSSLNGSSMSGPPFLNGPQLERAPA